MRFLQLFKGFAVFFLLWGCFWKADAQEEFFVSNVLKIPKGYYAVVVDKKNEYLYVLKEENQKPVVVRVFSCITGKKPGDKLKEGDQRTPEGVYFPIRFVNNLPPTYGFGAFPLNYPNLVDRKIPKRDGHGIWIHGTNQPNRPPHSSNGCIVLKNESLKILKDFISLRKTPVIIVSGVSFLRKTEFERERESLLEFIKKWKTSWENTPSDLKPYFDCYSKNFVWQRGNYEDWIKYKTRITKYKKWIKLKVRDVFLSKDGRVLSFGNLYVASFYFEYRSNNYRARGQKLLYIIKENGRWKILAEETF